jgi:cellobiose phosphorylase
MYRLAVESLLGLRREGARLRLVPCLPADWQGFKLRYRYFDTVYRIAVLRARGDAGGKSGVTVDGVEQQDPVIPLFDDRREHSVEVRV